MSRGVSLCHVAQFDCCIALGPVRSVRPVAYVWVLWYGRPPGSHWVLCRVFCWISSRFLWGYSTSVLSIRVCSHCVTVIFMILLFARQLMMMINATRSAFLGGLESPMIHRLLQVLVYYNCWLTVCFHKLDLWLKGMICCVILMVIKRFPFSTCLLEIKLLMSCLRRMLMPWPDFESINFVCWWFIYEFQIPLQLALDAGLVVRSYWLCA
jgi:hypothetical protein